MDPEKQESPPDWDGPVLGKFSEIANCTDLEHA
jgi:hypothetical protein